MEDKIEYLEEKLRELAGILAEVAEAAAYKGTLTTQTIQEMQNILVNTEEKINEIKAENKSFGKRIEKLEQKLDLISRQN